MVDIRVNVSVVLEKGRFPANIIHDGSQLVLDFFPETRSGKDCKRQKAHETNAMAGTLNSLDREEISYGDKGSAARFFKCCPFSDEDYDVLKMIYCAKASKNDRGDGNNHPTVKPVKLMEYLIKLITPPNGIVADCYAGSGTTGVAASRLGFKYILIEKENEYINIINKRLGIG